MDLSVLFSTFGVIFLAELGDKTQLTAMALAARYPWQKAFAGIAAAFALLNVLAVAVGRLLFELVPLGWIKLFAAALFLFFAAATLRGAEDDDDELEGAKKKERGPFLTSFILILFAELGDKTQLVTASLAAQHARPVPVFIGSTLALWLVSLLGLLVGSQLSRLLSPRRLQLAAAVLFFAFGAAMAYQAVNALWLTK